MKRVFEINLSQNFCCDKGYPSRYRYWRDKFTASEETWRRITEFLPENRFDSVLIFVGDAVQYASRPEISLPGAWSKEKMKDEIKRLASLGLEAYPLLDLGAAKDAWLGDTANNLGTNKYRETVCDLIKETAEIFGGPALFNIGMGDESMKTQTFKLVKRVRRMDEWAKDLETFSGAVRACGARPWIWADKFLEDRKAFTEAVPKDVVLSTQSYGFIKHRKDGLPGFRDEVTNSALELEELGYDQIVGMSNGHSFAPNQMMNMELVCNIMKKRPLGVLSNADFYAEEDDLYRLQYAAVSFRVAYDKYAAGGERK
ncbi:MAG: hypothetical protein IJV00_07655 [Clostridia bacterium]|nr:hypothetical protein [Clostridia bacterium]